jgi:uncharacterized protein YceH (UPF0502 family)
VIELSPVQQRVVGALAEKEMTTPDNYPLSMNALLAACNQSTNRDPVLSLSQDAVENALANLKSNGVARVVYSKGMRVDKYRHVLHEAVGLDRPELALLTVMMLRGPQTVNELRTRTERMHTFESGELESTLQALSDRELVELIPRQSGQREDRWGHLLGPPMPQSEAAAAAPAPTATPRTDRIADLEARVAELERRLDELTGET